MDYITLFVKFSIWLPRELMIIYSYEDTRKVHWMPPGRRALPSHKALLPSMMRKSELMPEAFSPLAALHEYFQLTCSIIGRPGNTFV